ncbi:MAG: redoxin domain-containing protein [Pedobacter sp.]|nr:MAG: redoxin domain-containing protein [Pedobacter sp.]
MPNYNIKKILILVTILAVPGFLYYLLQDQGKNRYKPLPFFGPKEVATTFHYQRGQKIPDTIYHQLPEFEFTNQDAQPVKVSDWKGKILILHLFDASHTGVAMDKSLKAQKKLSTLYTKNVLLRFASINVNESYTPEALKKLSVAEGFDLKQWHILQADTAKLFPYLKESLYLDALLDSASQAYTYSNLFVLVDSHARIRGYYEASNNEALSKLDDEIKVLIAEELRNTKDGR